MQKHNVRARLILAATAFGILASPLAATAQSAASYPQDPVKFIVPYPAGGVSDVSSRAIAAALGKKLGANMVIENKAGAASTVASTYVAGQKPNGYTLYAAPVSLVINSALQGAVNYKPYESFTPISMMMTAPFVLQTNKDLPVNNAKELVELIKKNPDKYAIGTSGVGSINHLAAEYFIKQFGLKMVVAHYKGGMPAAQDMIGGQVQMMFSAASEAMPFISSGKTRGLAVTSLERMSTLPDLPTMNEALGTKDFEATFWLALIAPAVLDKGLQDKLSGAMQELGKDDELRQRLSQLGINLSTSTPQVVTANLKRDEAKWTSLIESLNLKQK
ncbi:tripartite tricarboxylate transporter substrate binding protein [Zwartia sp.]|uniref:Bug family tripartite tricarboxylate transporter substrate binding protein n=1 Tax=Zwartia sp. TaxID=2978004 RepID=UPI002725EF27|nr:tripartite tricarboxylate transporter substrate binding protein [Zwartia sp.]MDO9024254.1 tripartite tricarboxylate transporter substrate binding protein [Zwartia sp.]